MKNLDKRLLVLVVVSLVILPVMVGQMADILHSWLLKWFDISEAGWKGSACASVLGFLLFLGLSLVVVWVIMALGKTFLPVRIHTLSKVPEHEVLIMLLSKQGNLNFSEHPDGRVCWVFEAQGDNKHELMATLDDVCQQKLGPFSWQQNLRALRHHKNRLKAVYLLGSSGNDGSAKDKEVAEQFFKFYLSEDVKVEMLNASGVDFESLEETRQSLMSIIEHARNAGHQEREMVIDITGGQKTASVAAALVTLDRSDLVFQYVGTGANVGKIIGFNAQTVVHDGA